MKPFPPDHVRAQLSDEELEAVYRAWESEGGERSSIPEQDFVRLLVKVRARVQAIDAEAGSLAVRAIRESRQVPRRHQIFALGAIAALMGLSAFLYLISTLLDR